MALTKEPEFKNEDELRDGLIEEIKALLHADKEIEDYCVTNSEPIDILTIIRKSSGIRLEDTLSVHPRIPSHIQDIYILAFEFK